MGPTVPVGEVGGPHTSREVGGHILLGEVAQVGAHLLIGEVGSHLLLGDVGGPHTSRGGRGPTYFSGR